MDVSFRGMAEEIEGETALVVVDMQNDFCHPDGKLFGQPSRDVVPAIQELIQKARKAGKHVIFTRDYHRKDQFEDNDNYDEFEAWGEHAVAGMWGAEVITELRPDASEQIEEETYVVKKDTYDAFKDTELNRELVDRGITELVICGTLADVCVYRTASSAALRDYGVTIVEDAVGYLALGDAEQALAQAERVFAEVKPVEEVDFGE